MTETANTQPIQPQAPQGLHPLLTWDELWATVDHLTAQQIRLGEELAQKECPIKRAKLTQVSIELDIANERLRVMANRT